MKQLSFLIVIIFCCSNLYAIEYRRMGPSYRALAMGNTGIASANDSSALFYNPAVMANIHTWWIDILATQVEVSKDAEKLYNDIQSDKELKLDSTAEIADFLDDYIGENPYIRISAGANLIANFSATGFSIGANYQQDIMLDIKTNNPTIPNISIFERHDIITQTGLSIPFYKGKWVLGVTSKHISRKIIEFEYGVDDLITKKPFPSLTDNGIEGVGRGIDVGLLYRLGDDSRTSVGIVINNLGSIDLQDAGKEKEEFSIGVSMAPQFGIFRWITALDIRDLKFSKGSPDDTSWNRRIHLGTELGIIDIANTYSMVSIRTGINQSYWTYGAEIALGHNFIFGYTQYSEEVGEYAGQTESPRKVYYLSLGF